MKGSTHNQPIAPPARLSRFKNYKGLALACLSLIFLFFSCKQKDTDTTIVSPVITGKDTAAISMMIKKANDFVQTNLDSMHHYAMIALNDSRAANYKLGIARSKAVEANYQSRKGNYATAIEIGLEAIKLYDSLGEIQRNTKMRNLLANTYKEMGGEKGTQEFLHKAIEIAREAQHMAEEHNYYDGIVSSLNQQGIVFRDFSKSTEHKNYMDSALTVYMQGLAIIEKHGDGDGNLGKLYNNISQVHNEHYKDFPKALEYLFKAVQYNKENNNFMSLSYNFGNISDVYAQQNQFGLAKGYGHAMLAVSDSLNAPHRKVNAYRQLASVAEQMKQYDSALYFTELYTSISDSLNNVQKSGQIAEMQTKYETVKKESQIHELSALNEAKNQRLWLVAGIAALLAAGMVVFVLQNRRLQQQKKQIAEQSDRLQWMMKELHHRVKNNLQIVSSLLNLQSYRLKDEESVSAIKESQLRVQAMSLMHQRLYQVEDVSMVNFKLYLDDLVETLMRAYGYGSNDFDLVIDIEKEFLDVDTVMPMGLLVNEIITNSFKYAYKDVSRPALTIRLSAADKKLRLDIADNGPGMEQAPAGKQQGFGKKLIAALTQQLKASYNVATANGTAYSFSIPYTKEKAA